jgi:hypothetical protein
MYEVHELICPTNSEALTVYENHNHLMEDQFDEGERPKERIICNKEQSCTDKDWNISKKQDEHIQTLRISGC